MVLRTLAHRQAPSSERGRETMSDGTWWDLTTQGQFLMDLEFLSQYTAPPDRSSHGAVTEIACVYTRCPPYLVQIACQFPWVHFYGFQFRCPEEEAEYDPEQPAVRRTSLMTLHTEHNRTVSPFEFSKDSAVTLSKAKEARPTHRLVMICHGETETRQAVLHAMLRADYSLLDICGTIPHDYLEGHITLPVSLPQSRLFACLVASQPCKCVCYDSKLYEQEMGESATCFVVD